MIITPLAAGEPLTCLAGYTEALRPRPYDYLAPLTGELLARYLRGALESLCGQGAHLLVARTDKGPAAVLAWRRLGFDSDLFGFPVARLEHLGGLGGPRTQEALLASLLARAEEDWRTAGIALLYAKVRMEHLPAQRALARHGFSPVGGWINYGLWLERWECPRLTHPASLRPATAEDARILENLAAQSFALDRFHSDPRISPTRADQLHRFWIRNSVTGKAAQAVLVAENDLGQVSGFLTYNIRDEAPEKLDGLRLARVILNAVDARERGQGVYPKMLSNVILECQGQADFLSAETQINNYAVQRSWAKLGLAPVESGLNFHYWLQPEGEESGDRGR
ncbi:hypothetical protein HS125_12635 [bacterium]|nr:hypothetical protein [bacterium]